jgi:hypothetical protein
MGGCTGKRHGPRGGKLALQGKFEQSAKAATTGGYAMEAAASRAGATSGRNNTQRLRRMAAAAEGVNKQRYRERWLCLSWAGIIRYGQTGLGG